MDMIMNAVATVNWHTIEKGTEVTCILPQETCFTGGGLDDFRYPQGTEINGTFLGTIDEIVVLYVDNHRLRFPPSFLEIQRIDAQQCFRCGWYLPFSSFIRHSLINDKSPILSEVCLGCYKRLKMRISGHNKEARANGGSGTLLLSEWLAILKNSEGCCYYCKAYIGYEDLIIEHMTPLSCKGNNSKENVVPACQSCNSSKSSRDIETWQRRLEAKRLLEQLEQHLGLSKLEVTNLAIKTLAQSLNIVDVEEES